MQIILEQRGPIVYFGGVECRQWQGKTARGVAVTAYIRCLRVEDGQDLAEFEAELKEIPAPNEPIPLKMLI
jgi:hypothetical protein